MARYRPNTAQILLLAILAAGTISACGGSTPVTNASPNVAGSDSAMPSTSATTSISISPRKKGSNDKNAAIPRLSGDAVSVAKLYLQKVGLRPGKTLLESNIKIQSGFVITTSPYAGAVVSYGSTVDLVVSTGIPGCPPGRTCPLAPSTSPMPDVIGQTLEQATTTLALAGITVGSDVVEASSVPRGTVICTVPAPQVPVDVSVAVDLGISSGSPDAPAPTLCDTSISSPTSPASSPTSSTSSPTSSTSSPTSSTSPSESPSSTVQPSGSP